MAESVIDVAIGTGASPSNLSLPELENVIERGQMTFIAVGRALMEIRDRRLYCETHATFEAYCRERWGWSQQHAHRQMDAARVAEIVSPIGEAPANEAQARAMLDRLDPEEREQVRHGNPDPGTVAKMASTLTRPRSPGRIPGVGRAQKASASKVMDRIFDQMRGMTLALNSCDCSTYEADAQELSDLTACIRALVRLRKHLEEPTHDR